MHSMIITPNPSDPEVKILRNEFNKKNCEVDLFIPSQVTVKINIENFKETFRHLEPKAALVRGFGAAPTQKIFFRLDLLSAIEEYGIKLINSRESLEIASDKFLTSLFLEEHGIPTPRTIICEDSSAAIEAFEELGGDVILKPLYGSKGIGVTRINDRAFAENVIYSLGQLNTVYYLQEFVPHQKRDIRILVLGNDAVAGMYRISNNWKTNVYAGARVEALKMSNEMKKLATNAAEITKTEIAGVDLIESDQGLQVLEVNSIPGFTALQKVSKLNLAENIVSFFLEKAKNKK